MNWLKRNRVDRILNCELSLAQDVGFWVMVVVVIAAVGIFCPGCVTPGPEAPLGERLAAAEATAKAWKESGARVFAAAVVPLSGKVWQRTELGAGGDGYIQLFAIWEPDDN